jgi:hypothetical protein
MAFLYGELDEHARHDFERHLLNCGDCASNLGAFKQIRSSLVAWRQESLGGVVATSLASSRPVGQSSDFSKPSAIAAIRQFLALSPLWMKRSIAFAAVLFCVVSVLAFAHLFENSKPVVSEEKRYSEQELQAKIKDAVKSGLESRETQAAVEDNDDHVVKPQRKGSNRPSEGFANRKGGRGPLTKSEREQLAADLRLITTQDEVELDILDDGNNE